MRYLKLWVAALVVAVGVVAVRADYNIPIPTGSTTPVFSFLCFTIKQCPAHVNTTSAGAEITSANSADAVAPGASNLADVSWLYGFNGTTWDRLRVDGGKNLQVNCAVGCAGGTFNNNADAIANSASNGQTAGWLYGYNGTTWDRLRVDGSKNLQVNCAVGCAGGTFNNNADAVATSSSNGQAAAWLFGFNGTTWDRLQVDGSKNLKVAVASLPLPASAATAANQIAPEAPVAPGAATATVSWLAGGQYNSTQPTFTNGQQGAVQFTSRGGVIVAPGADGFAVTFASPQAVTQSGNWSVRSQDGAGNALTSRSVGAQRAVDVALNDASGNQIGTAANPVRSDPTGTTTQPVSVASLPLPASAATSANQIAPEAPVAPATATATVSWLAGGQYNSTQPTFTNGQQGAVQFTARGGLIIAPGADGFPVTFSSPQAVTQSGNWSVRSQDGSGNALTSRSVGAQRAVDVALNDASGNQIGTSGNPVRTDPTGTTTQPASVADGSDVALGAKADAACGTDNGTCSLIALQKRANQNISQTGTVQGTAAAGAAPSGNPLYLGANGSGATSGHVQALISCDNHIFKHITSATDTLAVQGVAGQTIYVCAWRSRAAGVATWFLENTGSANANCSSTNTQLTGAATEAANTGETWGGNFWSGLKNTLGNGLCINSTGTGGVDVDFWYAQF